jgi:hypothetical protein
MRAFRYTTPVLTVTGGLLTGNAIRDALHHGHSWPLLGSLAAAAWTGAALSLWLPYLAERRSLLRQRAFLLRMRDEVPGMVADAMRERDAR